ncbi:C2 and GRAM domain-containing protein [Canna indica]|uniref:C2 and GRAM domain-containing protein n=1 Tax=Canna indica TaxID=4628 RepID=A0AAQ3JS03_9LILI|nr:C2 and GRAM domain-containing protein [Canna indica]
MKLLVHVIEARNLQAMDLNGLSDPYAKLQLGKHRAKTKVVKKNLNPVWDEEFSFRVGDLSEDLIVCVLDEDKYFTDDFLGQVKVPLSKVLDADNLTLGTIWYQLQPKGKKLKNKDCGEICLTISLYQKNTEEASEGTRSFCDDFASNSDKSAELTKGRYSLSSNGDTELACSPEPIEMDTLKEDKSNAGNFMDRVVQFFSGKNVESSRTSTSSTKDGGSPERLQDPQTDEICEEQTADVCSDVSYDELLKKMESKNQGVEMPANLPGGVLLDQSYSVVPGDLNSFLFSPSSNFWQSLADIQGTTGYQAEPWRLENGGESMKRVVTSTKAATKLVKAVTATEEQTYLKADGKNYAVLSSVSTPDVPFGSCFRTEVLYCIMPGPELSSEEQTSRLVISWRMNYLQSTMMKGMIENGAKQGLKESYIQFSDLLSQSIKPIDLKETASSKEQILASLQTEKESEWKLACRFFGNFTVISSVFAALYVLIHIMLSNPSTIQGLEFPGLDLPDSVGEIVVCVVLVLQGERVLNRVARYLQARKQRGSDHGIKAQGDGWLLTVALIEGSNLAAVDSTGYSDPYVVFTCNGKTKTSSIKFQTLEPQWNEIFEFDAMVDPPSMMDIDVYDFDGPFDEATSLGHAEVNFVKSNISDLVDVWIPLQGKLAVACQSKLHLRIFLNNTLGNEVVTEYLTKMEKEVGKKITLRSPQTNSAFQKLFGLPPEEFLINDFTCHLKRKMPMQGRLFLSPRIIGFHANLFGHKTKFFFLWEDIDDIQVVPPSLGTMGSPSLLIILRKGRGMDARHGAKAHDPDGRLKFQFQSFVSFNVANRTIMALWKARALTPEQKMQLVEEESEARTLQSEESGSFLGLEDAKMSDVFSSAIDVDINLLMELFNGSPLERRVMEKVGCVEYSVTSWESVKADVYQRQIHYKFDKNLYRYGGEVTSTQQKSYLPDKKGWLIEEVMALQGVLLGDYFNLHLRYQIEDLSPKLKACNVIVSLGIAWLKSTKHQKKITKNVISNSSDRLKQMFSEVENELEQGK